MINVFYGLFAVMTIILGIGIYHKCQYFRKKMDKLYSTVAVDKHDRKSDAFFIAAVPLIILVMLIGRFI